ncbi:MAG: hypothetical protein WCP03_01895 [Candidatus Saccharibacteria bacterium]
MKLKIKKSLIILATLFVPLMILTGPTMIVRAAATGTGKVDCVCADPKACLACAGVSPIMEKLKFIIRFLSALVWIVAVIMIVVGGIQYTTSNGNPQAITNAKKKIYDVLIGVFAYTFLWAFLEWIIPGGII